MASWHVSYEYGSGSNDGTSRAQAMATLDEAIALASDGDTIEVWDTARPYLPAGSAAWNAWTNPVISATSKVLTINFNDFIIAGHSFSGEVGLSGWSAVDANTWEKTIATGLYIDAVLSDFDIDDTENWIVSATGTLIPNCDLVWCADRATAIATAYGWFYNSGTGLLTVNTQGVDPSGHSLSIVRGCNRANPYAAGTGSAEYNGLSISGCSNLTFTGTFSTWNLNKFSNTAGYGVFINNGTDLTFRCRSIHQGNGYHGWGGAGLGSQTRISATDILIGACGPNSTHIVLYAGGNDAKVAGCDIGGVEMHLTGHRKPDDSLVRSIVAQTGCFGHTGGPGAYTNNTISGLRYHDIVMVGYGQANTNCFNAANMDEFTGDTYEEAGRAVVFERITVINGSGMQISGTPLIKDCVIDLAACGSSGTSASGAFVLNTSPSGDVTRNRPLLAGCVIRANLDRAGTAYFFNHIKPSGNADFTSGDGIAFKSTTVIDQSTQTQTVYFMLCRVTGATHNSCYGRGLAYIVQNKTAASSPFCTNDASVTAGEMDFKTCAYIGVSTTAMSDVATRNTQAEWTSTIDTGTGVLAPLFDTSYANTGITPATGAITKASTLNAGRKPSNFVARGINNAPFAGAFGAWQIPSEGIRGRQRRGRDWR